MLISLPQYSYLSKEPFDDIHMRTVLIWVNNPNDLDTIDNMVYDLKQVIDPSSSVKASYIDRQGQENVMRVIDIIFYVTIGIMMFLCFFSLVASMTANIFDQSQEIGVMRSIGITKYQIKKIYFYEALILVLSACLLGVFIGMTVGYTMVLQQNMFLQTKMILYVPWTQILQIMALSLICAFFATVGPSSQMLRKSIAAILRD